MAWNGNNDNWKWQLRDSKGRWIEMGRGVKWYSPILRREVSGTVVDRKGRNAIVELTSEPNDPETGKPQQVSVKGSDIEVIQNKATLGGPKPETPADATPAGPKASVPEKAPIVNNASGPKQSLAEQLDDLEAVTVQADEGSLKDEELDEALDEAKATVSGKNGDYTVAADKVDGDWNFVVSDKEGNEVDSIPMGAEDSDAVAARIDKSIADSEAGPESEGEEDQPSASTPAESSKSTAKKADAPAADADYNENGLTAEEQKLADGYDRMADRADKAGNFEGADKYRAQKDALMSTGKDRLSGGTPKASTEKAPETAPEATKAPEAPATPAEAPKAAEEAPKPAEEASSKNIEPSIGQSMFPEGFSIQKDTFGRTKFNRMVSSHTGAMTDSEVGKLKNLNRDYQLAQADQDPKRIAAAERELAKYARGVESRMKRDPEVTLQNRKIDALEQSDVNNVVKTGDPSDNWKKNEDGNWVSSKSGDTVNSADLVGIISPNSKSQTGYKPIRDKDMPKDADATPAPETAPESTPTPEATPEPEAAPEATPEPEAAPVDTEASPAVMSLPVTPNQLNRIRRAVEDAGMTENESGLRFTSDRDDPMQVVDLDKAEETLSGVRARVDDLISTSRTAKSKIPLNQVKADISANIARIRAERDKSGAPEATPDAAPAPEATPAAEAAKPEATPVPILDSADALAKAGVTRSEPYALPGEKFPPTRQQQDIIDSVLAGKDTAVQALAGSGKTTTLEALARRIQEQFPDKKIAYVAFNRSVKLEAEGRMPSNVEAKTQHGLAYGWAPKWMKDRSNDSKSLRRADDVAGFLGIRNTIRPTDGGEPMSSKDQALAAVRTVDTFANSAEDRPDASHMPEKVREMGPEVEAAVLDAAQKIWDDISKPEGQMRFSLDHMRKLWALTKPDLSKSGTGLQRPADIIFMDEAQDTPKVMAALMDHQTAQKVVVGDSNQNIYSSFTGSIDYMSQVKKDVELPLTKSWRFGPAVADIGNRFLELAKANTRVEGGGQSTIVDDMPEPDAILVRSNGGMIGEIIAELEKGRTVGVPAGTKKDLQSLVDSAAFLKGQGEAPSKMHDDLAAYKSWDEVVAEADAGNATMAKIANMVNNHGIGGMRQILNQIVEKGGENDLSSFTLKATSDPTVSWADGKGFGTNANDYLKQAGFRFGPIPGAEPMKSGKNKGQPRKGWFAKGDEETRRAMFEKAKEFASGEAVDVTISTAHKSKGLEWDKVKIGDDFRGPQVDETTGETIMPSPEELRVAYVAVTRAKGELMPGSLGYVFEYTQENGGIPEPKTEENDPAKDNESTILTSPESTDESPAEPEVDAPDNRPEDDVSREEAERINSEAPEAPETAPDVAPEPEATPTPEEAPEEAPAPAPAPAEAPAPEESEAPAPVARETPVPEEERAPEPEPEDVVDNPEEVPEPAPLPTKPANTPEPEPEAPAEEPTATPGGTAPEAPEATPEPETPAEAPAPTPAPEPAPEEAPAPAPGPAAPAPDTAPSPEAGERPTSGTKAPEPKALHPVKAKAANYPDGTVIRSARTGEGLQKTDGKWHLAGKPETPGDPMDMDNPYVYDMPKQPDDSFNRFEGIDSVGPGDIIVTRKGTQAAVVGKRNGRLVVAAHNQTDEQRRLRPALAEIDPGVVKGVNKFDAVPESATSKSGGTATERKRTPFSGNRGNTNLSIKDVAGNEIKTGDEVRTDLGTGTIVRVRPSDGPNGSAFVQFPDGTIKSFRSNKMRSTTAAAPEASGGDDPSQMEIGAMGEAGDGRAFMVGKGNKPIFKGSRIALADGREGTVSGFAKGVQSVNLKMDDGTAPRKKASVVDAIDYTAPATTTSESDTTPAPAPEAEAPATPAAEGDPEPLPVEETPVVEAKQGETPEEREERIAEATSNSKDPGFLSSWWDIVMKDDLQESDIYEIAPDAQWKMESMFKGELTRDNGGILAAKGWGVAAWSASKDPKRTPEQQAKMKDLQARITLFTQVLQQRVDDEAKETARQNNAPVRESDYATPNENMSLKTDRALKPQAAFKGAELDAYAGIQAGGWSGDLFGENSRLNVLSEAGKELGTTHVLTNSKGNQFRQGMKVYSPVGRYLGVAKSVQSGNRGEKGFTVRRGDADPRRAMSGGDLQTYNIERLMSQPTPPVWKNQADLTFGEDESYASITEKMTRAYPGVHFNFRDDIPLPRTREYAETTSKMLNKYPQLSATLTSVESSAIDPKIKAFAYASTSDHSGLRDTKVVFNSAIGKRIKGAMRKGSEVKYFNNVPEGREMEYVMTHEFGHTIDYMTGNISDNEVFELMKELLPPEVLADKKNLGKYLFDNGMISEYSKDEKSNKIYTVELVAESFADVELNGASAKPISKLVHAELMKRLDEMSGGTGVIPQGPAQAPAV